MDLDCGLKLENLIIAIMVIGVGDDYTSLRTVYIQLASSIIIASSGS